MAILGDSFLNSVSRVTSMACNWFW